jgi:hypothetical protein
VIGFGFFPHPQPLSEGEGSDGVIGFGFYPHSQPLSDVEGSYDFMFIIIFIPITVFSMV